MPQQPAWGSHVLVLLDPKDFRVYSRGNREDPLETRSPLEKLRHQTRKWVSLPSGFTFLRFSALCLCVLHRPAQHPTSGLQTGQLLCLIIVGGGPRFNPALVIAKNFTKAYLRWGMAMGGIRQQPAGVSWCPRLSLRMRCPPILGDGEPRLWRLTCCCQDGTGNTPDLLCALSDTQLRRPGQS